MSNKNKGKDWKLELYTKAYEIASRKGQIKTGTYGDPEQSGILDNYYHLISTEGKLLARFSLDQIRGETSRKGCSKGCAVLFVGYGVFLGLSFYSLIQVPRVYSPKTRAAAAANTLATMIKECAVKIADQGQGWIIVPEVDGYKSRKRNVAGFYIGNDRKVHGATILCPTNGEIKLVSEVESELPTFSINVTTWEKKCFAKLGSEAEKLCTNLMSSGRW